MNTKFNPSIRLPKKPKKPKSKNCKGCYYEKMGKKTIILRCRFCSRNPQAKLPLRGLIEDSYITKRQLRARGIPV